MWDDDDCWDESSYLVIPMLLQEDEFLEMTPWFSFGCIDGQQFAEDAYGKFEVQAIKDGKGGVRNRDLGIYALVGSRVIDMLVTPERFTFEDLYQRVDLTLKDIHPDGCGLKALSCSKGTESNI